MFHEDSFVPRSKRIVLGRVILATSAKAFVEQNPGFRISLLHRMSIFMNRRWRLLSFLPTGGKGRGGGYG